MRALLSENNCIYMAHAACDTPRQATVPCPHVLLLSLVEPTYPFASQRQCHTVNIGAVPIEQEQRLLVDLGGATGHVVLCCEVT